MAVPWLVALALQADGWYLRSEVIWHKPSCMPESVRDRPTRSHETVFLLTKAARYFWDADGCSEPSAKGPRVFQPARGNVSDAGDDVNDRRTRPRRAISVGATRNARTVWTIPTEPFPGAHFATFPKALAERCIRAGSKDGSTVLDPFGGAGTTALVANRLDRDAILIELNPEYAELARARITDDAPMFRRVTVDPGAEEAPKA